MTGQRHRRHEVFGIKSLDPTWAAGEVRRYLRFARLADTHAAAAQLIIQAKHHARTVWRIARELEKRG